MKQKNLGQIKAISIFLCLRLMHTSLPCSEIFFYIFGKKKASKFQSENLKRKHQLKNISLDGDDTKRNLGNFWGCELEHLSQDLVNTIMFHKTKGIFWRPEQLSASQDFYPMVLVSLLPWLPVPYFFIFWHGIQTVSSADSVSLPTGALQKMDP